MGIYLNPDNDKFKESYYDDIFVDKSELIIYTNDCLKKNSKKNICVSRPRRFGKSVNLNMLSAYYSSGCNSREMFEHLKEEMRYWYNGYQLEKNNHLYCPRSVISALLFDKYDNYWSKTETYESLARYISMNFDGLNDSINKLLAGEKVNIMTDTFQNDMTSVQSKDDVLTLLVHLGYLAYLQNSEEVCIPNKEVEKEYLTSMRATGEWENTVTAVNHSKELLELTLAGNAFEVANRIEKIHMSNVDPLHYNNEQALRYVILIAYYYAREKYNILQEMPTGKGYADIILKPNFKNPNGIPIIIELKYNSSDKAAIAQIKDKQYFDSLKDFSKVLLVGINYNKDDNDKKHTCIIEEYTPHFTPFSN